MSNSQPGQTKMFDIENPRDIVSVEGALYYGSLRQGDFGHFKKEPGRLWFDNWTTLTCKGNSLQNLKTKNDLKVCQLRVGM